GGHGSRRGGVPGIWVLLWGLLAGLWVLPLFRGKIPWGADSFPMTSGRPLEPRDARPKIWLDPPVEREQLAGGLLSGFRLADGAHVILAAFAPAALPFIMPEVQVLV